MTMSARNICSYGLAFVVLFSLAACQVAPREPSQGATGEDAAAPETAAPSEPLDPDIEAGVGDFWSVQATSGTAGVIDAIKRCHAEIEVTWQARRCIAMDMTALFFDSAQVTRGESAPLPFLGRDRVVLRADDALAKVGLAVSERLSEISYVQRQAVEANLAYTQDKAE
ncbi:MAG: hypothetical protein MI920_10220 [Kiloniellales bacterium]|nr:hypothetical protein [Kiloniellales bacterium]